MNPSVAGTFDERGRHSVNASIDSLNTPDLSLGPLKQISKHIKQKSRLEGQNLLTPVLE